MAEVVPTPLAQAIEDVGFRRDWVAHQLGVSKSTVSRWCDGSRTPSDRDQDRLALLLRRQRNELFPATTAAA